MKRKTIYYLADEETCTPFYVGYTSHPHLASQQLDLYWKQPELLETFNLDRKWKAILHYIKEGHRVRFVALMEVPDEQTAKEKRQEVIDVFCYEGHPLVNGSVRRRINTKKEVPLYSMEHMKKLVSASDVGHNTTLLIDLCFMDMSDMEVH